MIDRRHLPNSKVSDHSKRALRRIHLSAITAILVCLVASVVACDRGGRIDDMSLPTPPEQANLSEGVIDVCHRWGLDDYFEIIEEFDSEGPGSDNDIFYIDYMFASAACTTSYPSLVTEGVEHYISLKESGVEEAEFKVAKFYADILSTDGFAAIWNNAMRKDGERSDGDTDREDENWTGQQKELQVAFSEVLSLLTNIEYRPSIGENLASQWIELGQAVVQTRTYNSSTTPWSRFAKTPYDPGSGGWDYSDWEVHVEGPQVYGWSILAPLLRFGDFDESFLIPVATAIIEFDREHDGNWLIDGQEPISFDAYDDDPVDSMDAVLESLSRNPAAAQAVYDATGDERVAQLLSST